MSQSPFIFIHDIVNQETGKTYRQMNLELQHNIPVGALIEIIENGVRLFVAEHHRDCDGTPLYSLTPYDQEDDQSLLKNGINKHVNGYPEDSLVVIKAAS